MENGERMVKRFVLAAVMTFVGVSTLSAQTKYSSHTQMRTVNSGDQMSAMIGAAMSQVYPPEGVDQTVYLGDLGMRVEVKQAMAGMPAGTVLITKADGTRFGMDPAAKTFWKIAAVSPDALAALGVQPNIKVSKTGQFETIAGMKAEKVIITVKIQLPGVDPANLPPGMPAELGLTMTVWMTDALKAPKGQSAVDLGALSGMAGGALKELAGDGRLTVKSLIQGFGMELETTTRDYGPTTLTPAMLAVPEGFKEIPQPQPKIGG
jgi:hypothetical protein